VTDFSSATPVLE